MPSPGWAAGPRVGPCLLSPLSIPAPVSTIRLPGPNSSSLVPIPSPWFWSSLFGPHPGSWVPIPDPWSPPAAGASLDAAEPGALSGSSSGQRRARAAETRDTYLPGRLSATRSSLAGVRPRGLRGRWSSLELGTWRARDTLAFAQLRAVPRTRHAAAPSAAPGLCPALPRRPLQADHTLSPPQPSTPVSLTLHRLLRRPASSHPLSPRASALAPSSNFPRWSPPAWEPLDSGWKVPGPSFHKPRFST